MVRFVMSNSSEPKLAAPGAGLPVPELWIARVIFRIRCIAGSSESFTARFVSERAAIRKLIENLDVSSLEKRVLIARPPGLEDSSRYWSGLMTLDHLRIVNLSLGRVISSLAAGKVPEGKASTADVKPDPNVTSEVISEYESSCDLLLETLAAIGNPTTRACFTHPWFGPLDVSAWHALAGTHLAIHRVQIERILSGLR